MPELFYWIWLSLKYSVSHKSLASLLAYYGSPKAAYNAPAGEFAGVPGISRRDAEKLEERNPEKLMEIFGLCRAGGIIMLTPDDPDYPERLKNIYFPPAVLYVRGNLPALNDNPAIAVIGTRHCTEYGLKMGKSIAADIASRGAVVISGLTKGIDAAAAEGTLSTGGTCIGVLGTAIDEPQGGLCEAVLKTGALVSEYPPQTESCRQFFRARNRISAGMSVGVVVVEAPEKSGTRLFVDEALEQGKDIFAVPGNADSPASAGTLKMIAQGAKPVVSGADVLSDYQYSYASALHEPRKGPMIFIPAPGPAKDGQRRAAEKRAFTQPDDSAERSSAAAETAFLDPDDPKLKLSPPQKAIISAVNSGSTAVDEIISVSGLPAAKVLSMLTILEIKGLVIRKPGNHISINPKHK